MSIHSSAVIDPTAELGEGVEIGAFSYIGPNCHLGDGTKIASNVVLQEYVTLGKNCQVSPGAVLGGTPQDLKFKGETSYVIVGDGVVIRECVTINRASGEGLATTVGPSSMLMAYTHLGHNCVVGTEAILANSVQLGGHVEIGDYAFIGGVGAYHQFVKIGKLAIIGGFGFSRQDVPPFAMAAGGPVTIAGINKLGLKRRGYDLHARTRIKRAYQLLFFSDLNTAQGIEAIRGELDVTHPDIQELLAFVENSKRGIHRPHRLRYHASKNPPPPADSGEMLADALI